MRPASLALFRVPKLQHQAGGAHLNRAFCTDRAVVPIDWSADKITVGMANPGDEQTIRAIRFATGAQVDVIAMSADEVLRRLHQGGSAVLSKAPDAPAGAPETLGGLPTSQRGPSLVDLVSRRLDRSAANPLPLKRFKHLVKAGYALREVGQVMLAAHRAGDRLTDTDMLIAEALVSGAPIVQAIRSAPRWLDAGIANLPDSAPLLAVLSELLASEERLAERRAEVGLLRAEVVGLTGLAVVVGWSISALFAMLLGATGLILLVQLGRRSDRGPDAGFVCANILELIGTFARHGTPPAAAIRAGMERFNTLWPTWGRMPDTRPELAAALKLGPLAAAMLAHGDLAVAADAAAHECAARGSTSVARLRSIARLAAIVLFGVALAVLLI